MTRIFLDRREMDEDLRGLFDRLDHGEAPPGAAAECRPPVDVVETADGVLVTMDLAGMTADSVKVLFVRNMLVIVGHKRPAGCEARHATFHLAERGFGRFARGVRLAGAFDAGRADATLKAGELRVRLPRIEERRGGELRIRVRAD
jgi:HSP20 family protein